MDKGTSSILAAILVNLRYSLYFAKCDEKLNHIVRFNEKSDDHKPIHIEEAQEMAKICNSLNPDREITLKMNSTRPVAIDMMEIHLQWTTGVKSIAVNDEAIDSVLRWDGKKNLPLITINNTDRYTDTYFNVKLVFKRQINASQIGDIYVYSPYGTLLNNGYDASVEKIVVQGKSFSENWYPKASNAMRLQKTKEISIKMKLAPAVKIGDIKIALPDHLGIASVRVNHKETRAEFKSWHDGLNCPILSIPNDMDYTHAFQNLIIHLVFKEDVNTWPINYLLIYDRNGQHLKMAPDQVLIHSLDKASPGWMNQSNLKGGAKLSKPMNEIWITVQLLPSSIGKVEILLDDPFGIKTASVNNIPLTRNPTSVWDTQNSLQFLTIYNPKPYPDSSFNVVLLFHKEFNIWPIYDTFVFERKGKLLEHVSKNVFGGISHPSTLQNQIKGGSKLYQPAKLIRIEIYWTPSEIGTVEIALDDPFDARLRIRSNETAPLQVTQKQVTVDTLNVSLLFLNQQSISRTQDLELILSCRKNVGIRWPIKALDIFGRMDCDIPDQHCCPVNVHRDPITGMALWANYTCPEGQIAMGNFTRVCQSNGNWSDSPPHCELIQANGNIDGYVIGGAICLVILILAIIISVVIILKWKRRGTDVRSDQNSLSASSPGVMNNGSRGGTDNSTGMDQQNKMTRHIELNEFSDVNLTDQSEFYMVDNDIYGNF